jgi:mxaJ protein
MSSRFDMPKAQMRIARRFNAGSAVEKNMSPEGTVENKRPFEPRNVSWFAFLFVLLFSVSAFAADQQPPLTLRIAADPNNLPFSNDKLEGFENKIADIIAAELNAKIEYIWHAQRRGFFRETLTESNCDLVMGVPVEFDRAIPSKPYYRSSYVFVSREDRNLFINSFDDPALKTLKIGVLLIGDNGANPPPAHALANRDIVTNLVGFSIYGDYKQLNPPARIIEAVAQKQIDVAIVWGPLAGYFADKQQVPMRVVPLLEETDKDGLRYAYDICIGVKKNNEDFRDQIDAILIKRKRDIDAILDSYHVPRARSAQAFHQNVRANRSVLIALERN